MPCNPRVPARHVSLQGKLSRRALQRPAQLQPAHPSPRMPTCCRESKRTLGSSAHSASISASCDASRPSTPRLQIAPLSS